MNKYLFTSLIFSFFLFTSLSLKAQNVNKKLPLSKVIDTLETRYKVTFTYADKTIENITVGLPSPELSLEGSVTYLNKNTKLHFAVLGDNQVVIRALSKRSKPMKKEIREPIKIRLK